MGEEPQQLQLSSQPFFTIHMGEPQQVQLSKTEANGAKETNALEENTIQVATNESKIKKREKYYHWFIIALYASFLLIGQSAATLLGRLYYEKGGNSKWMGTLVQIAGFPILLPYYFIKLPKNLTKNNNNNNNQIQNQPSPLILTIFYISFGLFVALNCYLYSVGLRNLPVSTFSLICSSQLAFNAFFSYFLNSLKFTFHIVNSLVLLTISSTLLVFQPDDSSSSDSTEISKKKYIIGFICTVAASAGYGLWLSLTQVAFKKILKSETFKVVMDLIIYQALVATCVTLIGLFASGEYNGLREEMRDYQMGKASYFLNLVFTAVLWQVFSVGCVGLIFEVSSLFSNAISVLGVPIVPMLAVVFFHDKMKGIKVMSMVLAIWGFVSYVYQQYLDDSKSKTENTNATTLHDHKASSTLEEANR